MIPLVQFEHSRRPRRMFPWDTNLSGTRIKLKRIRRSTVYHSKPDLDHSEDERRYIVLGLSDNHRALVVCYAEFEERTRIISARRATRSERNSYEEE